MSLKISQNRGYRNVNKQNISSLTSLSQDLDYRACEGLKETESNNNNDHDDDDKYFDITSELKKAVERV